jgi:hypothetical protein
MTGALPVQSKVFLRDSAAGAQVIVVVRATPGGLDEGWMEYSPSCKSDKMIYREGNTGFNTTFVQCLMVAPAFESTSLLQDWEPELIALRDAGKLVLGKELFLISSYHAVSTGALIDVQVFLPLPIAADAGHSFSHVVPDRVLPTHVVWGRKLKEAVRSTAHSISGRLAFPPVP